jgi:hypothetical protein
MPETSDDRDKIERARQTYAEVLAVVAAEQEDEPVDVCTEVGCVLARGADEPREGGFGLVVAGEPVLDELE